MPSKKINKQQIINASIELLRNGTPLSSRNIAKFLNCSTQPIYYLYKNMCDIENDLYLEAKNIFDKFVNKFLENTNTTKYKAFGLAFIDFAKQEKGLFKFLYLDSETNYDTNRFQLMIQGDVIKSLSNTLKLTIKQAEDFQRNMGIYTFRLAMMQYFNCNISNDDVSNLLTQEFTALTKVYKENNNSTE